jgi:hypothetical protein
MADYIPPNDEDFNTYIVNKFLPYLTANATPLGVTAAKVTALTAAKVAWGYAWTAHLNAQNAAQGATITKDSTREDAEELIREIANAVQANPDVTDTQKELLGITVRKTARNPAAVPTTVPIIQKIDTSSRGILRLHFVDFATPDSKAKPAGVRGCEIRAQIGGTAPVNPDNMAFLATESRTPYRADFEPEDIGKTAYFACRWVNTRNQTGPWSQIYSAVIPS